MRAIIILSISVYFLIPNALSAQQKYEREYRIKSEMVPKSAKKFIGLIGAKSKAKWFREIGLKDVSIEAKFMHKGKKFSVEFDTLGKLQDVEFILKKNEINPIVYTKFESHLDSLYQKWKFEKIQIHYRGQPSDILSSLEDTIPNSSVKVFYEIVLKGKASGNTQLYEITFNDLGELQTILQIIQDKADHLEY